MKNTKSLKSWALATTLLGGSFFALPAIAQEELDDTVDESQTEMVQDAVIITGSRIANSNLTATSPITSVGSADLALANTVNSEQFLNTLPQVIPGFDSSSNNPGIGEATVDLRGLGSERSLVLVNGRRFVSSNQNPGVVDLNTIPTALIEQVDILTGGASAVYGSDALAGVVNFQLKDDFEGFELDTSYETSEDGDGAIWSTGLTVGGNFDNDRGNAVMSVEYTSRESIFQGDRVESEFTLNDGGAGIGFSESGSVNIPSTFVFDTAPDFTSALGLSPPCTTEGTLEDGGICTTDSFGWIFSPDGSGIDPFINSGPNTNRYNYAPANYLQIPQERYSLFTAATYDITDDIEAYAQAIFVSSQTEQLLAPTPVFTTITVNLDNPFLAGDTEALALLTALSSGDSDGDGVDDAVLSTGRRFTEVGPRLSDITNDSFQFSGGLRGDLTENWSWNLFGSFGQANTSVVQTGNISRSAYQAAVREGRANIFIEDGLTDDIVDEISVTGVITGRTEESVISADIAGEFAGVKSPFATNNFGFAIGTEYRENSLETEGAGLDADTAGFNQAPSTFGSFDVVEYFTELNAPLIEDATFAEEVTLTGAFRASDYSTVGGVESYAGGLSYTPVEGYRIRGQYQRAVRAPNIGELFQPQINGFPNIADPCSGGDNGGFDDLTAAEQTIATAQCTAYGVPTDAVGTPLQVNAQIEGLFGGNPNLEEEVADTYTVGVVLEPSFIDNLSVTIDYYDITIENVIGTVPSQTIFDLCYVDAIDSFCGAIRRNSAGLVVDFDSFSVNSAKLTASGVDFTIEYDYDLGKYGDLGLYSLIGWVEESALQSLPTEEPVDCVGYYGATCGEPSPEWTFNTRVDWSNGPWGARLRWQRISSVEDDLFLDGGTPDLFVPGVDAYDQVDLTGYYDLNDNVYLSVGVENLFDTEYQLIGDASAEQSNTYPATYDTIGRTFFVRSVISF